MLRVRLLETATAESLALARILVLVVWLIYVIFDPIGRLALLPIELFHAHGLFGLFPSSFWEATITPTGLLGYKTLFVAVVLWAMIGFKGARAALGAVVVLALIYLQIKKGFGGHWDHREMPLLYVTALILICPAWDAFSYTRSRGASGRREGVYRAALLVATFIVIVQYVFIGAARLFIGGPGVFTNGTLQTWIENRNLRPNPFGVELGALFLDPIWSIPLDLLFLGGTLLEIAILALLFLKPRWLWLKVLFIIAFVAFHTSIFLLMNVAFPEDVALLLLFFDLAVPLRVMRRGHTGGGTLTVDPTNARAVQIGDRARDHSGGVLVTAAESTPGGLRFVAAATGEIRTGREAHTEVLFRERGRLFQAWWRASVRRVSGDVVPERSAVARWFLGPINEKAVATTQA